MSLHTLISSQGSRAVAALFGFVFTAVAAAPASAQKPVVFGDVITEPGFYFLAGNQTGSGTGIRIESSDVVLFLSRFTLRGDGTKAGIVADGRENVLVYGGRVTNFEIGMSLHLIDHWTLKDTRIDHNRLGGLVVFRATDCSFTRIRCDHNQGSGIDALGLFDCRFLSVLAHDNDGHGIFLGPPVKPAATGLGGKSVVYAARNKIKLCWAAYNGRDGIRVFDAVENEIARNQCVNNDSAGIRLGTVFSDSMSGSPDGSHDNSLWSNWCVFNETGIVIEWGSRGNTLTNNTALASFHRDMVENNYELPCVNTWFLNFFLTKDGDGEDCIF